MAQKFVVNVPVADLSEHPVDLLPKDYSKNPFRLTQALFGEKLSLIEEKGDWLYVEALEQPHFNLEKGWHFYEGWIRRKEVYPVSFFPPVNYVVSAHHVMLFPQNFSLSFGTYVLADALGNLSLHNGQKAHCHPKALRPLPKNIHRKVLIEDAKRFLKLPYLWGGRSFHTKQTISSVDCSGLINLIFRAQGKIIPRDAHPQYLAAASVNQPDVGDLLFLAKEKKVTHVMIKLEGPYYLDASETETHVRFLREGHDLSFHENKIRFHKAKEDYSFFVRTFCHERVS